MSAFTPEEVEALRRLVTLFPDKPFCLIGASALRVLVESYWRHTRDLDVTGSSSSSASSSACATET